jgi:hypothetical protein
MLTALSKRRANEERHEAHQAMNYSLPSFTAADGSRHFAELPQSRLWNDVRDHVSKLPGATLTDFACDGVTEA